MQIPTHLVDKHPILLLHIILGLSPIYTTLDRWCQKKFSPILPKGAFLISDSNFREVSLCSECIDIANWTHYYPTCNEIRNARRMLESCMSKGAKMRFFNAIVIPMLYTVQVWILNSTEQHESRLQVMEIRHMRRMEGLMKLNGVRKAQGQGRLAE